MKSQKEHKETSTRKRKPKPKPKPPIDVPPLLLAYMPSLMKEILDGSISLVVNQQKRLSSQELKELVKNLQNLGAQILVDKDRK